jgi:hypothetical protein
MLDDYRTIGPRIWERFHRGRNDQLWYFNTLVEAFESFGKNRIVDELKRVIHELTNISAAEST